MKKIFTLCLAGSVFYAGAQSGPNPDAYAKTITPADMRKHLYILASPQMEGRETGTNGQHLAAAYIETYFKSMGLKPGNGDSYQMPYNLYQDSLTSARFEVNGKAFELDKDFTASASSPQTTQTINEVLIGGTAAVDSLTKTNLTGKAILILGTPARNLYAQLMRKYPAAVLIVDAGFPRSMPSNRKGRQSIRQIAQTGGTMFFQISENVAKAIAGAQYDAAKATPASLQTAKTNLLLGVEKTTVTSPASDVLALLPGADLKDQYLVFSAHYDHLGTQNGVLFPGADDDGSGTVGVLEIAEAFAKAAKEGKGPRRSILFLCNSGEEKGLLGSEWYTDHPVYPLDKTTADLNIDMIGRSDPDRKPDTLNYVYVVGDDKLSSDLKPISEGINNKYTKLQLDYKYNDPNDKERIYFRSDHYNFARYGVPIIFYYDGMLRPDYHRPTDTPDKINYDLMQKRAQLVFYTGWEMANRDAMLKRDIPLEKPGM